MATAQLQETSEGRKMLGKSRKMIAYVRACNELNLDDQYAELERFAKEHHIQIQETYCDIGKPITGLHHAMDALEKAEGLIVCNLNRLVEHTEDRLRDLRPILHHFCTQEAGSKHLISIEEGIDTATAIGQANAIELINKYKEAV